MPILDVQLFFWCPVTTVRTTTTTTTDDDDDDANHLRNENWQFLRIASQPRCPIEEHWTSTVHKRTHTYSRMHACSQANDSKRIAKDHRGRFDAINKYNGWQRRRESTGVRVCESIKYRSLARILSIFRLHFMDGVLSVLRKIPFEWERETYAIEARELSKIPFTRSNRCCQKSMRALSPIQPAIGECDTHEMNACDCMVPRLMLDSLFQRLTEQLQIHIEMLHFDFAGNGSPLEFRSRKA